MERLERENGERVVLETDHFLVACPFAPRFPFETWILPRVHLSNFEETPEVVLADLGEVMHTLAGKLEKVLDRPAYNAMLHSAPLREGALDYYHWHIELIVRLSRVAGFEWGSGVYLNHTPPEAAAKYLREA
jgi:UDPglucose--hexose-1-phosphate uridylyltransferase